jgi:hypothetical protein
MYIQGVTTSCSTYTQSCWCRSQLGRRRGVWQRGNWYWSSVASHIWHHGYIPVVCDYSPQKWTQVLHNYFISNPSPMCLFVTLPSVLHLFSKRSCTDKWFLTHLKTHDWYLRSGHTLWFCKKMSVSCKDTTHTWIQRTLLLQRHTGTRLLSHSVTFLSPILQTICTVIYSILLSCQVWLPDERWGTDGTPPCPHCFTQTEVSRIYVFILIMYSIILIQFQYTITGWLPRRENRFGRRVIGLDTCYFILSRRYICHACQKQTEV